MHSLENPQQWALTVSLSLNTISPIHIDYSKQVSTSQIKINKLSLLDTIHTHIQAQYIRIVI